MTIDRKYFILLLVLLFATLTRVAMHLLLPDMLIAFDSWAHLKFSGGIVSNAHISPNTMYTQFPGLHIITVFVSLISNISLMHAYKYIIPTITTILLILSAYLLTQNAFGDVKCSCLSAFIAGISDLLILRLMFSIPESIGLALFAFLVYVLMRFEGYTRYGLVGFILIVLSYTHPLSFFISMITSCSLFIFVAMWERKDFINTGLFLSFAMFLLYIRFFKTLVGMWLLGYLHLPNIVAILLLVLFTVAVTLLIKTVYLQAVLNKSISLLRTVFGNTKIIVLVSLFMFGGYIVFNYHWSPTLAEFYKETFASLSRLLIFEFGLLGMYFLCNKGRMPEDSIKYVFLLLPSILLFGCSFYFVKSQDLFYLPFRIMSFVFIVMMPLASLGIIKSHRTSIKTKKVAFLTFTFLIIMLSSFYTCYSWYDEKYYIYPTSQEYTTVKYMDSNLPPGSMMLTDGSISRLSDKFKFEGIDKSKIEKLQSRREEINTKLQYIVLKKRLTSYMGRTYYLSELDIVNPEIDRIYNNVDVTIYKRKNALFMRRK